MDIGAINKGKGYKGKGYNKGKGYGYKGKSGKGHGKGYKGMNKGKHKSKAPIGQGHAYSGKGWQQQQQQAHKGKGKGKNKSKQAVNICYRCGLEGHYAKDCKVAVYNLNDTSMQQQPDPTAMWWNDGGQAYATDWWHEDHTPTHGQQIAATAQSMQQQQHGIQQPVHHGQSVSGLLIAMTAYTDSVGDVRQEHDMVELMIDSGAATHVCPQWFAPKFQLHALPKGEEPQLRTVTNTKIKVHGYKYVIMKNYKGQPIVIPFYVCDVHAPILSVTRLTEQGFTIQLSETPTITHKHGFETQLVQREGLYFMRAEITQLPQGTTLTVQHTDKGQIGMIAPTMTLTPTGPATQAGGGNADYWYWNEQGYLVRHHTQYRRSLFIPRDNCPIPHEDLGNYRKTIVKFADSPEEQHIEEAWQDLNYKQQKRMLPGNIWRGETWFRTKPGARDRYNERVAKARHGQALQPEHSKAAGKGTKQTTTSLRAEQQLSEAPRGDTKPTRRLTQKTTELEVFRQADTSIPAPSALQPNEDYWIREGPYWKRVHIKPRTALYKPEQTEDGPDITMLTSYRSTMARPTTGERFNRFDDEWTGEHKELSFTWTGSTNFEEKEQYKAELDNSEDEHRPQQALKAKGVKAPAQPTPQERAEHELTHLPYRSWCTICVQSKGRQDHHKAQQSKQPVIQCDFAYIKGLQDKTVVPIFTAIDVQTGMGMAVYVHDKTQQLQYLQRCLQNF